MVLLSATSTIASSSPLFGSHRQIIDVAEEASSRCYNEKSYSWDTKLKSIMCQTEKGLEACKRRDGNCTMQGWTPQISRRESFWLSSVLFAASLCNIWRGERAGASEFADMPALRGKDYGKSKMRYPDYTITESGLQYKDLRVGAGAAPKEGDIVVVDWDGYTIGYYGRIFEARNKAKGGSFEGNEKDYLRIQLGNREVLKNGLSHLLKAVKLVIPAFEEALLSMNLGGVRRIIVPPELGYPGYDFNRQGPRPTTFSGQRALDFVLKNQGLIDKTLLFDIELLKISPS